MVTISLSTREVLDVSSSIKHFLLENKNDMDAWYPPFKSVLIKLKKALKSRNDKKIIVGMISDLKNKFEPEVNKK